VPSVVIDTSVALPATLSPRGMTRKLWLLLAVGALAYRAEHLRLELDALNHEPTREDGGEVHGAELLEGLAAAAEQRLAVVREHLPDDAPQDWVSLGSAVLFDEYERKVREVGSKLNPSVSPEMAPMLRRQFEAICVGGPAPFDPADAPGLTRDPADDAIVYTALVADADFLISDDRDIVPDGDERVYEHGEHRVLAVRFGRVIREHFRPADLDWGAIDGTMLTATYRHLGSGP
jgi:predicted nucleic acid-binding protein